MTEEITIRHAARKDMPAVLTLIKELAEFEREADAVEITLADLERDGFSSPPLFRVFVAEMAGSIIGMALYYLRYSTWKGKTIHLEDLIVNEGFRSHGAGYALLEKVVDEGRKMNVRRIEWNVLDWNTPACEFYKRCGAKILEDWRVVHLDENAIRNFSGGKTVLGLDQ